MSHPEASQPEVPEEQQVEPVREESQGLTQREFLKKLVGSAAGLTGLAAAGTLLTPKTAEAAYTPGGSPYPAYLPGDQITTNVHVNGSVAIRGHRPWLDVTAFGASGDWTTGADGPVAAALAATPPGGVLFFPAGIYAFANPITISNRSITIMGAGRGVTYMYFYPGAGFNITQWDPGKVTIRDIHMQCGSGANSHPAIRITAGFSARPTTMPHIHDIFIDAVEGSSWAKCIELNSVSGAKIERFEIDCGSTTNTIGIHVRGGSTITNIASGIIQRANAGIQASDQYSEGLYIRGIEVLEANIGYLLESPGPGSAISDCHAATAQHGIKIVDHGDMALIGNLLYGGGIDCDGTGVNPNSGQVDGVYGAHNLRIIGNQITRAGSGPAIRLSGYARNGVVHGNVLNGVTSGVELNGGNVTGNIVTGNRMINLAPAAHVVGTGVGGNWTTPNY